MTGRIQKRKGENSDDFDPKVGSAPDDGEKEKKEPLLTSTTSNKTLIDPKDNEFPDLALIPYQVIQELWGHGTMKKAKDAAVIWMEKQFRM